MTAILAVQALVFQDGGLLALGANVVNMALVGVLAGYLPFHYLAGAGSRRAAAFTGGVLSVVAAACMAIAELRISGVPMPGALLGVSLGLFLISALIGARSLWSSSERLSGMNPTWVTQAAPQPAKLKARSGGCGCARIRGRSGSFRPSGWARGLAEKTGIAEQARNLFETPLADYECTAWNRRGCGKQQPDWVGSR
jgi:cobalt/nickel transport system permease protein